MSWRVSKPWKHQHTSGGGGSSSPPPPPPTEGTDNPPVTLMDNWIIENGWKGLLIDPQSTLVNEAYTDVPHLYMRGGMYWVYPGNVLIDEAIHVEQRMSYHNNYHIPRHVKKAQAAVVLKVNGTLPRHDELKIVINNFGSTMTYSFSRVHSEGSYNYYFYVTPEIDFPRQLEMTATKLMRFNVGTSSTEYTKTGTIFYGYKGMPNDIYRKLKEVFVRPPYQGQFDSPLYVQGCHLANFGNVVYGGLKWFRPTKTNPTPSPAHVDFVPTAPVKPLNDVVNPGYAELSSDRVWSIFLVDNIVVPTEGDSLTRYKAKSRIYIGNLKDRKERNEDFIGAPVTSSFWGNGKFDSYDHITYNIFGNRKVFDYVSTDFFDWNPYINMSNTRSSISAVLQDRLSRYDFRVFSIEDRVSDFIDLNSLKDISFDVNIDHKDKGANIPNQYDLKAVPVIIRTIYPSADKNGVQDRYDIIIQGDLDSLNHPHMDNVLSYNRSSRSIEFKLFENEFWKSQDAEQRKYYIDNGFKLRYAYITDKNRRYYPASRYSGDILPNKIGTNEIVSLPINLDMLINNPVSLNNDVILNLVFVTDAYDITNGRKVEPLEALFHIIGLSCKTRIIVKG